MPFTLFWGFGFFSSNQLKKGGHIIIYGYWATKKLPSLETKKLSPKRLGPGVLGPHLVAAPNEAGRAAGPEC